MLKKLFLLISLLSAGQVFAANWEMVGVDGARNIAVKVDKSSVTTADGKKSAWFSYLYPDTQKMEGIPPFRFTKNLYYFDCDAKTSYSAKILGFNETDAEVFATDAPAVQYNSVTPGTTGELMLNAVCKNTEDKKK